MTFNELRDALESYFNGFYAQSVTDDDNKDPDQWDDDDDDFKNDLFSLLTTAGGSPMGHPRRRPK